jgi:hypothetical protein
MEQELTTQFSTFTFSCMSKAGTAVHVLTPHQLGLEQIGFVQLYNIQLEHIFNGMSSTTL